MLRFNLLFLVLLISGCQKGPPLGEVSGTVKFEGKPIESATVMFTHSEGRAAFARTDAQGYYELNFSDGRAGALLGENAISIESGRVGSDAEGNVIEYPEILPAKYNVESELTRTIVPGVQVLDFDLTKD